MVSKQNADQDDGNDDALDHLDRGDANEPLDEEKRGKQEKESKGLPLPCGGKDPCASGNHKADEGGKDGKDGKEDDEAFERETTVPAEGMHNAGKGLRVKKRKVADVGVDGRGDVDEVVVEIVEAHPP